MMNNLDFEAILLKAIWEELNTIPISPNEVKIEIQTIKKNNLSYRGICFSLTNAPQKPIPVFSIDQAIMKIKSGQSTPEKEGKKIVLNFTNYLVNTQDKNLPENEMSNISSNLVNILQDKDTLLKNVRLKLIGIANNEEFLSGKIYKPYLDMAVIYYVSLSFNDKNYSTVLSLRILPEGITIDDIHEAAMKNSFDFEVLIISMAEYFEKTFNIGLDMSSFIPPLYIVKAEDDCIPSANLLLMPDVYKTLCEKLNTTGLYILPSSIYETLCLDAENPFGDELPIKKLKSLVTEINATEIAPEDKLTDNVYFYSFVTNTISIAKEE